MELKGKTALVSGGSRGIGAAIVQRFLEEGARVYSLSRSEGPSAKKFAETAEQTGGRFNWIETDICDPAAVEKALDKILEEGEVDILVHNAGITRDGLIFRMKDEDWESVLQTNLGSAFRICRRLARPMIKRRSGSIVNISSIVGMGGNAGQTNYAASKAGLIGFSKSLAKELASRGVRVNVVAPGYIDTSMTEGLKEEQKAALTEMIALGRTGKPEEVAEAVLFLASERASYISGQVLPVDGGLSM
jgi:3-oxoacyl-[acyl-carrier protein] reductase